MATMSMNNGTSTNILADQPTNVSTSVNARHIGIGVGIAVLVIAVVGAIVFGVFTLLRRRRGRGWATRRRQYSSTSRSRGQKTNNPKYYTKPKSKSHQLPSLETRMMTPTRSPPRNKTWGSDESTKSLEELVKKPAPIMAPGNDNRV